MTEGRWTGAAAIFLALLLPLACGGPPPPGDPFEDLRFEERSAPAEDPYALYLQARLMEEQGDEEGALAAYERVVRLDPLALEALIRLGQIHYDRREFEEAARDARAAVEIDPTREEALTVLARSYMETGETDRAIARFEALADDEEEGGTAHYFLSILYDARGESDRALEALEGAVAIAPEEPFFRYRLAEAYRRGGDPARAEREYRKAADLAENDGPILFALARLYGSTDRFAAAAEVFEELADRGFRPREVHYRLVGIYLQLGDTDRALLHAEALEEMDPNNAKLQDEVTALFRKVVEIDFSRDRLDEAERLVRKVLSRDNGAVWAWTSLSYIQYRRGDYARSIRALETAQKLDPGSAELLFLLGSSYLAAGHPDEALRYYRDAYDRGYRPGDLLFRLGGLEEERGNTDRAIELLRELVRAEPDDARAMNYLGYLLAEKSIHLDEAEELVLVALRMKPDNAFYRDSLGWVYFRQGKYDSAVRELERAHNARPDDPVIGEHLADAYAKAGRIDMAKRVYRSLLSADATDRREALERKLDALSEAP